MQTFVVIFSRAYCNDGRSSIENHSDRKEFAYISSAVKHGFKTLACDDFVIGEIRNGRLISILDIDGLPCREADIGDVRSELNFEGHSK